ncbi:helix-turn-helix domain-containing protein [Streptomyces sediminimaris]|uniref:helix-turn-helix domain-containing protein n=1 Tax=Streptomyces sediminimaris TaxID=3383721 RepID=UPI00399C1D02
MSPPTQDPQRLKRRRIEAGLNQGELAAAAGIHPSHMSWLERGMRGASPRVLKRLAEALDCEIADLMPPPPEAETGSTAGAA